MATPYRGPKPESLRTSVTPGVTGVTGGTGVISETTGRKPRAIVKMPLKGTGVMSETTGRKPRVIMKMPLKGTGVTGVTGLILLSVITLAILAAPLLPLNLMDRGPSLCVFCALGIEGIFKIFGIHSGCPGCGMSRAVWAILHGDVNRAIAYNWRVILAAPILVTLYINLAASLVRRWFRIPSGAKRGTSRSRCSLQAFADNTYYVN
jgi:hypothetical protein